jgi:hypothetical protein
MFDCTVAGHMKISKFFPELYHLLANLHLWKVEFRVCYMEDDPGSNDILQCAYSEFLPHTELIREV